jgi:hypothetical protein
LQDPSLAGLLQVDPCIEVSAEHTLKGGNHERENSKLAP